MNVGELREVLAHLPDNVEVTAMVMRGYVAYTNCEVVATVVDAPAGPVILMVDLG